MAKKVAVEALLKLRDEISQNSKRVDKALGKLDKTTRKTKGSVKALGASLAKVGLGLGIASIALKKVLAAQSLQIKSINSLNLALANQGNLLPGTSQRLQEYASELQGITTFGDEVILQNQALLASFGMNENQLKTTTKAALDFAAATGSDLKAAVNLLGKAFVGETGSLSRYGIVIDSSLSKTAKFDAVIQQLTMRFGGAAQAETKTFTGQMEQLGNQFGDTSESIGKFIGFLGTFGGSIQSTVAMLKRVGTFFSEDLVLAVGVARKALLDFGALYVDVVSNISKVGNELFNASSSGGAFSISFEAAQQAAIEAGQTIPTLQEFTAQWEAAGMATSETKTFLDDLAASLRFQGEELASQAALAASAAGATIDYSAAQEAAAAGADSHAFALGGLTTAAAAFKNAGLPQEIDSVTDANRRAADAADMHAVLLGIASKRAEELGIVGPSAIQPITLASVDATAAMGSFGGVIGEAQGLLGLMGVEADSAFGKILGWADKVMSAFDGLLGLLGKLGGGFGSLFEGGGGGFSLGGLFGGGGAGGAAAGGAAGGLGGLGGAIAGLATNPFTIGIAGLTAAIFGLSKLFGKGATAGQEFDESGRRFGAVGGAVTEGTRAHIENLRSQTGGSIQGISRICDRKRAGASKALSASGSAPS